MAVEAIKISNLTKIYKSKKDLNKAVDNLSFTVSKGEIFGLIGPNGAGKTTTIKLILGLLRADEGEIRILGFENENTEIKKLIGYLPESPSLPSYLRGEEFLEYMGLLYKIDSKTLKERIHELSYKIGLDKVIKKRVSTYSKGMVQRLSLGQALINNPEILILDEPTNGLDPSGIIEFRNIIQDLKKEGKTIFISSHNLTELEKICDRAGFLRAGNLKKTIEISSLQNKKEIEITLSDLSNELLEKLKETGFRFRVEGRRLFFETIEEEKFPSIIRAIDESGITIKFINMKQESLEELYLRYVEEKE